MSKRGRDEEQEPGHRGLADAGAGGQFLGILRDLQNMVYGGLLKDGPAPSAVFRMCRFQRNEVYRAVPRLVTESSHMRAVRRRNDTAMGKSHAGSRF